MEVKDGLCWIGTNGGKLLLYDDQSLEFLEDYSAYFDFSSEHRVVGLHYNDAHLLACSASGSVKMLEAMKRPKVLWEWQSDLDLGKQEIKIAKLLAIEIAEKQSVFIVNSSSLVPFSQNFLVSDAELSDLILNVRCTEQRNGQKNFSCAIPFLSDRSRVLSHACLLGILQVS